MCAILNLMFQANMLFASEAVKASSKFKSSIVQRIKMRFTQEGKKKRCQGSPLRERGDDEANQAKASGKEDISKGDAKLGQLRCQGIKQDDWVHFCLSGSSPKFIGRMLPDNDTDRASCFLAEIFTGKCVSVFHL